jgi:hypothetical protein
MRQNNRKYFLYDLSLPLEERQREALSRPYDNGMQIARLLAVNPARIYANAGNGNRIYSKAKNKWYAVRQR